MPYRAVSRVLSGPAQLKRIPRPMSSKTEVMPPVSHEYIPSEINDDGPSKMPGVSRKTQNLTRPTPRLKMRMNSQGDSSRCSPPPHLFHRAHEAITCSPLPSSLLSSLPSLQTSPIPPHSHSSSSPPYSLHHSLYPHPYPHPHHHHRSP